MPGEYCEEVRRFHEEALKAEDEREVKRVLEEARQMLIERGFQCENFPSCLTDTLALVRVERARRPIAERKPLALPLPQVATIPGGVLGATCYTSVRREQ